MGITIHWDLSLKGDKETLKAKLEAAISKFIEIGIKSTRLIEFEFPACVDAFRSGMVEKMLAEKYPDAANMIGWYYIQATPLNVGPSKFKSISIQNGKPVETIHEDPGEPMPWECLGFGNLIMAGCEPMNIALKNSRANPSAWLGHSFCKTQYAHDFEKAHLLVCKGLDILKELGFEIRVEDEAGFYGTGDQQELFKQKEIMDVLIGNVGKMFTQGGFDVVRGDGVVIPGKKSPAKTRKKK